MLFYGFASVEHYPYTYLWLPFVTISTFDHVNFFILIFPKLQTSFCQQTGRTDEFINEYFNSQQLSIIFFHAMKNLNLIETFKRIGREERKKKASYIE